MPQEILNENYDHLDKVDIFSLGVSMYELIRRLPLPESGCQFFNLKEGKLPLLPGHSLQFQNLLKVLYIPFLFEMWRECLVLFLFNCADMLVLMGALFFFLGSELVLVDLTDFLVIHLDHDGP